MTIPIRQTRGLAVGVNDLATTDPLLASEMAPTGNGGLGPKDFTRGSNQKVNWICVIGHQWVACINDRSNRGRGCPFCSGHRAWPGYNDLVTLHPEVADQLIDPRFSAEELTAKSNRRVRWKCPLDHEWDAVVSDRTAGTGCPTCCGKKVLAGFNDLRLLQPELANQLVDREIATTHTPNSNKKVEWRCAAGHTWSATISDRVRGSGCRICSVSNTSRVEQTLAGTMRTHFSGVQITCGKRLRVRYGSKTYMVPDIVIAGRVIVEYDGSYWHKNTVEADTEKTEALLAAGYLVVRVRECCRGQILGNLPIAHPNLLQIGSEYAADSSHIQKIVPDIIAWITARLT